MAAAGDQHVEIVFVSDGDRTVLLQQYIYCVPRGETVAASGDQHAAKEHQRIAAALNHNVLLHDGSACFRCRQDTHLLQDNLYSTGLRTRAASQILLKSSWRPAWRVRSRVLGASLVIEHEALFISQQWG